MHYLYSWMDDAYQETLIEDAALQLPVQEKFRARYSMRHRTEGLFRRQTTS
jgi:hypothetical protein